MKVSLYDWLMASLYGLGCGAISLGIGSTWGLGPQLGFILPAVGGGVIFSRWLARSTR